jgi:hypothetical protein
MTDFRGKHAFTPATLSELDTSGIGAAYATLVASQTRNMISLILASSLNGDVYVSLDGTNNHFWLPAGASLAINFAELDTVLVGGTTIYVKDGHSAPSSGYLTASPIYRS